MTNTVPVRQLCICKKCNRKHSVIEDWDSFRMPFSVPEDVDMWTCTEPVRETDSCMHCTVETEAD